MEASDKEIDCEETGKIDFDESARTVLNRVPESDRVGLIGRAVREGKHLHELVLREDYVEDDLSAEQRELKDVEGLRQRLVDEGPETVSVRSTDSPDLLRKMVQIALNERTFMKTDPDSIRPMEKEESSQSKK